MTWIRCSDRMPMGEACIATLTPDDSSGSFYRMEFESANVETLRRSFGDFEDWIDRTEWRPLDEAPLHDEGEPATWHDETRGWEEEHVEWLRETERNAQEQAEETLRDILELDGIKMRWFKLTEEMGELSAELGRWFGPGFKPGSGHQDRIAEEAADVSIVLESIMTDPGWGEAIRAARARKLARLRERLGR